MEGLPCQVKICAMNVPAALTLGFGGPKMRSKLFSRPSDFDQIGAIKMLIFSNLDELTFAEEGHITESFGVEEPLKRGEYVGFI